jgi:hypothetical protein
MVNLHKNTIMIIYFISTYFIMQNSEVHSNNSLQSYYAFHRVSAVLTHKEISESKLQYREIGTVLFEHENSLIVVAGENRKEHVYLIPITKVDHCGNNKVYCKIPESSLKGFEI